MPDLLLTPSYVLSRRLKELQIMKPVTYRFAFGLQCAHQFVNPRKPIRESL